MKFPFMFVLPHGHKNHSDSFVCVCLGVFFFFPAFKLLITCPLSFVPLGWRYVCNYYPFFFPCACEPSGLHQTEQKGREQRRYLRVKTEKEEGKKKV